MSYSVSRLLRCPRPFIFSEKHLSLEQMKAEYTELYRVASNLELEFDTVNAENSKLKNEIEFMVKLIDKYFQNKD